MAVAELIHHRFKAMGTWVHLAVRGADGGSLAQAERRILDLESRWSRFVPDSEVSRMNAAAGPVRLSAETFHLLEAAIDAWKRSGGRFDPTVHDCLVMLGYDRSYGEIDPGGVADHAPCRPCAGCADILADPASRWVLLPHDLRIDFGGIGKGHAADLVAGELVDAGADGACVNIGGDVCARGVGPGGGAWRIALADPRDEAHDLLDLGLASGAVATSSTLGRRWNLAGADVHHLIDPSNGRPSDSGLVAVTAVTGSAIAAEVLAKVALLAGPVDAPAIVESHGGSAALFTRDGVMVTVGGFDAFVVDRCPERAA